MFAATIMSSLALYVFAGMIRKGSLKPGVFSALLLIGLVSVFSFSLAYSIGAV